jgi:hypothetical protein
MTTIRRIYKLGQEEWLGKTVFSLYAASPIPCDFLYVFCCLHVCSPKHLEILLVICEWTHLLKYFTDILFSQSDGKELQITCIT